MLAIEGDLGDGIPGCKGVSSAAAPLIREYGSIENLYEMIESCEENAKEEKLLAQFWKDSLGISRSPMKALKQNKEMVFLSKKLATMRRDINLTVTADDLRFSVDKAAFMAEIEKYEMKSLIEELNKM